MTKLEIALLKAGNKKPEKSMVFFMQKKPPISARIPAVTAPAQAVFEDAARSCLPVATVAGPVKSDPRIRSCEGIYPDYQKKDFQAQIIAYVSYATINESSLYKPNSIGSTGHTNLYMKTCNAIGVLRKTKLGNIHSCNKCYIGFYVRTCIVVILLIYLYLCFNLTIFVFSFSAMGNVPRVSRPVSKTVPKHSQPSILY